MVDDHGLDQGQSAFWATQAEVQAPPIEPVSPQSKKRRLLIGGSIVFVMFLILLVAVAPKRRPVRPAPTPPVEASPTPVPLQDVLQQQFDNLDQKLQISDPGTMLSAPQVDMMVDF